MWTGASCGDGAGRRRCVCARSTVPRVENYPTRKCPRFDRKRMASWRAMRPLLLALLALALLPAAAAAETFTGHIASERPDWVYVPFDVPAGTNRIDVSYTYDKSAGNALDIGLFGPEGFRGWSGGARTAFTVSAADSTPGYRTGRITPGRWQVILGPYTVVPPGIDYTVEVTLHAGPQAK